MRILLSGANGRMGHAVARQAAPGEIVCGVDPAGGDFPFPVYPDFSSVPEKVDVIIDFSKADALHSLLEYAMKNQVACVLCATGYTDAQLEEIRGASETIPVFRSANMSIGVAVLRKLSTMAASLLGDDFDIEIVEAHHNQKMDAPSGTAIMLFDAVNQGCLGTKTRKDGRSGMGKREKQEVGMHALRGGTVAGTHEVHFFGQDEELCLTHRATSRQIFVNGAVAAAKRLLVREPGFYTFDDLMFD